MPPIKVPLHFNLDTSGVGGFFGGEETIAAMATLHLYRGRRWLGWYNSPGSYAVAKRFGQLASSRFWDGLFPGPNLTPAESFGLDGKPGPKYWGVFSGTNLTTGHLGYLVVQKAQEIEAHEVVQGRETTPMFVTVIDVGDVAPKHSDPAPTMSIHHALLAAIPITFSFVTCALAAASEDWIASALILFGIIASGVSCFVIGSARVEFGSVKQPAPGVPPADGLLLLRNDVVVIRGAEKDVDLITKGQFVLKMSGGPEYRQVGLCSLLLLAQFLIQLLGIAQATKFGQAMFLVSLAMSWVYNSFLSSLEPEKIQVKLLWEALGNPRAVKTKLKNRASQAAFSCMVLRGNGQQPSIDFKPKKVLECFIPNDTRVWHAWRDIVAREIEKNENAFEKDPSIPSHFEESEKALLSALLQDARKACEAYQKHLASCNRSNSSMMEKDMC